MLQASKGNHLCVPQVKGNLGGALGSSKMGEGWSSEVGNRVLQGSGSRNPPGKAVRMNAFQPFVLFSFPSLAQKWNPGKWGKAGESPAGLA